MASAITNSNAYGPGSAEQARIDAKTGATYDASGNLVPSQQDTINSFLAQNKQANQPSVDALNASIPHIEQNTQSQIANVQSNVDPLKAKYDTLLQSIKGDQASAVSAAKLSLNRDYIQRGNSVNDSSFDQALAQQVNPLNFKYDNLATQNQQASDQGVRDLLSQIGQISGAGISEEDKVRQSIADLISGGNRDSITQGLQSFQNQQANTLAQQNYNLSVQDQARQQSIADQAKQLQAYQIANPQLQAIDRGGAVSLYNPTTGKVVQTLQNILNGGNTTYTDPKTYTSTGNGATSTFIPNTG